jgi:RND family efflux transporter MFP subunit
LQESRISGIINDKFINVGSMVNPGTQIADIVDISKLKTKVNIQESDVFKVKSGDAVSIKSDIYPGTVFKGKIESVSAKGDSTHNFAVEISMKNDTKNPLKAGMSVKIDFDFVGNKETNFIPRVALAGSIKDPQVFVVDGKIARLRNIVIGSENGTDLEVVSGLSSSDKIVVSGQNNLIDNTEVTIQQSSN